MNSSLAIGAQLLGAASSSGVSGLYAALLPGGGKAKASATPGEAIIALKLAERSGDEQIARIGKDPIVSRDVERFKKAVAEAKSVDELLDDPTVRKVLLTANGLGDQADYVSLVKKALTSDGDSKTSLARKLTVSNQGWLSATRKYDFNHRGLAVIQKPETIAQVADEYVHAKWLDSLDETTPGLGNAMSFKEKAASFTTPLAILGSPLARDVVTTTLSIPKQLAFQPLDSQESAIARKVDTAKFADPAFVDRFVMRYLIAVNSGGSTFAFSA